MTSKTKKFNGVTYTFRGSFDEESEAEQIKMLLIPQGYHDVKILEPHSEKNDTDKWVVWVRKSSPSGLVSPNIGAGEFDSTTLEIVKRFKDEDPWKGELNHRIELFRDLHDELMQHYKGSTKLITEFIVSDKDATECNYNGRKSKRVFIKNCSDVIVGIVLVGRLSVVTYFNAIGILRGHDDKWGLRFFKETFPEDYAQVYGS